MMKLLILGIDALDRLLLASLSNRLPHFSALRENGIFLRVKSTFPPDSDTAWATIYTGLNPARHGIVSFVDPLDKSHRIMHTQTSNHFLHGRTFWDIAGGSGLKSCILFPHLGFPLWESSCDIIVRSKKDKIIQSSPPELIQGYSLPHILTGIRGLPKSDQRGMKDYFHSMMKLAEADAKLGLHLIKNKPYNLFLIYWSTVDALGHFFWPYFDPGEPGYLPEHPFRSVIPEAYQLFDQILGEFLSSVPDDVHVMVMSDHGHGGRPSKLININEILRQSGFLFPAAKQAMPLNSWLGAGKGFAVKLVNQRGLGRVASTTLRFAPNLMQLFTHPSSIDWERTIAFATDMSGVKAYPYGGIMINRDLVKQENYEAARDDILHAVKAFLSALVDPSAVRFVSRREEIYSGPFLEKYPDIVLDLAGNYGLGWGINCSLITDNTTRSLVPGSHSSETGTFLMRTTRQCCVDTIDLSDVAPSILDLLEINHTQIFDGRSIFC